MIQITKKVECDKCGHTVQGDEYHEVTLNEVHKFGRIYHVCKGCWPEVQSDIASFVFGDRLPQDRNDTL
jgi:hypothetical protein